MSKKFKINGKIYNSKPLTFEAICAMEELGVSVDSMDEKPMSTLRAYFAYCSDLEIEFANAELAKHIKETGNLDAISKAYRYEIDNSDFFQPIMRAAEAKVVEIHGASEEKTED